jgi:signal peptidase I
MENTLSHPAPRKPRLRATADRLAGTLLTAVTVLLALATVATGVLVVSGHSLATERSGSMAPMLHRGDLLISTPILADQAHVGDVITFSDPNVPGVKLTHRVRAEHSLPGGRIAFVTRGDANTGSEYWNISAHGRLTALVSHVPAVGLPLIAIDSHPLFAAIVIGIVLWLLLLGLIWGREDRGDETAPTKPRARVWPNGRLVVGTAALLVATGAGTAIALPSHSAVTPPTTTLAVNDAGEPLFTLAEMVPGDSHTACEQVTNNGPADADVAMYGASSGTGLAAYLHLTIVRGSLPSGAAPTSCAGFVSDNSNYAGDGPGVIYSGMLNAFASSPANALSDPVTDWAPDGQVAYQMTVSLAGNNDAERLSAVETFTFGATAVSSPPSSPTPTPPPSSSSPPPASSSPPPSSSSPPPLSSSPPSSSSSPPHSLLLSSSSAGPRGWVRFRLTFAGKGSSTATVTVQLWRRGKLRHGVKRQLLLYGRTHVVARGPGRMGIVIRPRRSALRRYRAHPHAYRVRITVTHSYSGSKPRTRWFWIGGQARRNLTRWG